MSSIFTAIHRIGREQQFRDIRALRTYNLIVAAVHLGLLFMFFQINISRPVTVVSTKTQASADNVITSVTESVFAIDIFTVIATYLGIAILAHLLVATLLWKRYVTYLKQHRNPLRWIEYSLSCSLMLVALALSVGMADYAVLLAVFGLSFAMNICGMIFENIAYKAKHTYWSPFVLGCVLGAIPWALLLTYTYSDVAMAQLSFPVAISWTVLIIYLLFPLNMYLSALRIGPWKSYVTTEAIYISLSLFAKALLAGLLYFNLI